MAIVLNPSFGLGSIQIFRNHTDVRNLANTLGEGVTKPTMSIRNYNLQGSRFRKIGKMSLNRFLTFRHSSSSIKGQAFHYSPENTFLYI